MDRQKSHDATAAAAEQAVKQKEGEAKAEAKADMKEFSKQLSDYKEHLQRLQAEFENYKKRVEKEKLQFRQFAAAEVVKSFLPVLDSFELALKSINSSVKEKSAATATAAEEKIVEGMELIYAQFYSVLESLGLKPIRSVGERLDPYRHEVLMQEETADGSKDNVVVEEFQKGYALNDIILRYSKVKVLKFAKSNDDKTNVSGGK